MHQKKYDSMRCIHNNQTISKQYMCDNVCKLSVDTLLIIYIPLIILSFFAIMFKIFEKKHFSKRKKHNIDKKIQCEFVTPHHLVIEPDNSLSIIINS